jgi:hypothetical protein
MHRVHNGQGWKQIPNGVLDVNMHTGDIGGFLESASDRHVTNGVNSTLTGKEALAILNDTQDGNRLATPLQKIKFASTTSLYNDDKECDARPDSRATLTNKFELRQESNCQGGLGE